MQLRLAGTELLHGDGRKDGHEEPNSHFSQLSEHVSKATCFSLTRRWLFQ